MSEEGKNNFQVALIPSSFDWNFHSIHTQFSEFLFLLIDLFFFPFFNGIFILLINSRVSESWRKGRLKKEKERGVWEGKNVCMAQNLYCIQHFTCLQSSTKYKREKKLENYITYSSSKLKRVRECYWSNDAACCCFGGKLDIWYLIHVRCALSTGAELGWAEPTVFPQHRSMCVYHYGCF